jgi:hypothetical protein
MKLIVNPLAKASPATTEFAGKARAGPHVCELNCALDVSAPASARPAMRVSVDAESRCTIVAPPQCVFD